MTMPMFPSNPYAVVKDSYVVAIIYASEHADSLDSQIKNFGEYDSLISFNEYGEYISIGAYVLSDGFVAGLAPYPSWTWDNQSREWTAPSEKPTKIDELDTRIFSWNEDSQAWQECINSNYHEEEYYLPIDENLDIDLITLKNVFNTTSVENAKEKTNAN